MRMISQALADEAPDCTQPWYFERLRQRHPVAKEEPEAAPEDVSTILGLDGMAHVES